MFALMVNRLKAPRFAKAVQTITYIPNFISTVVLVSMMSIFFAPNGLINQIVNYFGVDTTITYSNGKQFDAIFVISGIWQAMGFNSIIYVAALSNIDPTMYEAAKIDGASTWKIITTIDLPTIMPTIVMMLIMNIGNLLSVSHDKILLMQTGTNIMQSEIISTYVYKMGITNVQYSYSTAIGLFNAVINFALLLSANWISKKTTDSGLF
jgi:putative aldouronate transport system permease protein